MINLDRTRFALEQAQEVVKRDGFAPQDAFASHAAGYVLIVFSAEMEEKIEEIIKEFIRSASSEKITEFVFKMAGRRIRRREISDLHDNLRHLGKNWQQFDVAVGEENITQYGNFITQRNNLAHNPGAFTISWQEVQGIAEIGEGVLIALQEAIRQ